MLQLSVKQCVLVPLNLMLRPLLVVMLQMLMQEKLPLRRMLMLVILQWLLYPVRAVDAAG